MMKRKIWILCMAAALMLTATACRNASAPAGASAYGSGVTSGTQSSPAQSNSSAGTAASTADLPTASALGRAESSTISVTVEGQPQEIPATLYVGSTETGRVYSLYIPSEGWKMDEPGEWESTDNKDVELKVDFYPEADSEAARSQILDKYDEYGFMDTDENGWFSGEDGKNAATMNVQLMTGEDGTFALLSKYPDEAEEGFAPRLAAMVATLQVV